MGNCKILSHFRDAPPFLSISKPTHSLVFALRPIPIPSSLISFSLSQTWKVAEMDTKDEIDDHFSRFTRRYHTCKLYYFISHFFKAFSLISIWRRTRSTPVSGQYNKMCEGTRVTRCSTRGRWQPRILNKMWGAKFHSRVLQTTTWIWSITVRNPLCSIRYIYIYIFIVINLCLRFYNRK